MTYFSAFSGAGGFELALRDHECIGFSEISRAALAVYRYHFPDHTPYGDITQLDPRTIPTFDLLVAGFPCQAYSVAGRRRGFADARGALFFDLARLIAAKRPRLLLLENVRGLLSHANGQTFARVLATLDELGYDCQWEVRHAREYTAQDRRRLFVVGHRRGTRRPEVFPLAARDSIVPAVVAVTRSYGIWRDRRDVTTIDASYGKGIDNHGARTALHVPQLRFAGGLGTPRTGLADQSSLNRAWSQHKRVYDMRGLSPALSAGEAQGRYTVLLQRPRGKNRGGARTLAPTVTRGAGDGNLALARPGRLRRLTPRECERLMTWPDDWTRYGIDERGRRVELSDRQRYILCGNGVVSACVRPIIDHINST